MDNLAANPDSCSHRCGNGALDPSGTHTEQCDDANTASGDGCSATCTFELLYSCSRADNTASSPDVCTLNCGNGVIDIPETCDDGNVVAGDGCDDLCSPEDAYICIGAGPCTHRCGNGALDSNGGYAESCDDGNLVSGDGCTDCAVDQWYRCTRNDNSAASPDSCVFGCGNGVIDSGEECDTGIINPMVVCNLDCTKTYYQLLSVTLNEQNDVFLVFNTSVELDRKPRYRV